MGKLLSIVLLLLLVQPIYAFNLLGGGSSGVGSGCIDLDDCFDSGRIIDGATSSITAVEIGGVTNRIKVYELSGEGVIEGPGGDSIIAGVEVPTNSKAANYTIGTDDAIESYGGVIYVTSAATITAEAIAVGMSFTVITIGAIAVSVDVNASDRMYLDGTALDDGDKATNQSTSGDMLVCTYESAAGWYCTSSSPSGVLWTDGGA